MATFLVIQPETVFGSHDADVSDDTDDDDGEEADDMEQVYGYLLACLSGKNPCFVTNAPCETKD